MTEVDGGFLKGEVGTGVIYGPAYNLFDLYLHGSKSEFRVDVGGTSQIRNSELAPSRHGISS